MDLNLFRAAARNSARQRERPFTNVACILFRQCSRLSKSDLELFIGLFGRLYGISEQKLQDDDTEKAERLARKRTAADRIIARRPVLPPDFDEKKELLDYLDERYTVDGTISD